MYVQGGFTNYAQVGQNSILGKTFYWALTLESRASNNNTQLGISYKHAYLTYPVNLIKAHLIKKNIEKVQTESR